MQKVGQDVERMASHRHVFTVAAVMGGNWVIFLSFGELHSKRHIYSVGGLLLWNTFQLILNNVHFITAEFLVVRL